MFEVSDSKSVNILLQQTADQAVLKIDQFQIAIDLAEAQIPSSVKAHAQVRTATGS